MRFYVEGGRASSASLRGATVRPPLIMETAPSVAATAAAACQRARRLVVVVGLPPRSGAASSIV